MSSSFIRSARVILLLVAGAVAGAGAQEPLSKYPPPQTRFEGVLQAGTAGQYQPVQVDLRTWTLAPGVRRERLPLPADSIIIIELHAGELETDEGSLHKAHRPGEIWRVPAGESIAFSTRDDSVTLTTLALRPR